MKICYATDYLPGYHKSWGGAEQVCYRWCKLLTQNGHQLSILATKPVIKPDNDFDFSSIPVLEDSLPMIRHPVRYVKSILFPYDLISHIFSYRVLKRSHPDVLHLHNCLSLSFALILSAKRLRIPVVCSVYDYWFLCPLGFLWKVKDYASYEGELCTEFHGSHCLDCLAKFRRLGFLQKPLLKSALLFRRRIFDFFIKRIDGFVVLSSANAQVLERYGIGKERIQVVHIPLSEEIDVDETNIERNSILYVGWLHPRKGPHVIVEAMPHILQRIPDARLYLIGEEANKEYMAKINVSIRERHLEQHVFLLGRKPYSEVKGFLRKANVLVVPEQWETIAPNALTEGLVFGKAIVASAIGGTLDFIKDGENGLLADTDDPRSFAHKIISILENEPLRYSLSKEARKTGISLFAEEIVYQQLLNLYQSLGTAKN